MPHTAVQKRLHALVDTQELLGGHDELNIPNPTEGLPPRGPWAGCAVGLFTQAAPSPGETGDTRATEGVSQEGPIQCPYVALPRGRPIDKGTLCRLLDDPLIFVLPKRKGQAPRNATMSVASIAGGLCVLRGKVEVTIVVYP